MDAIRQWQYKPTLRNGEPVEVETMISVKFELPAKRVRIGGNVQAKMLVYGADPVYPEEARRAHVVGTVLLHVIVATDGAVQRVDIVSGPPLLLDVAKDAVQKRRYKPTLLNGEPVEVDTAIAVVFQLSDPM